MKHLRILVLMGLSLPCLMRGGGLVADRPTLTGILGGSGSTDTFNSFVIVSGTATDFTVPALSSTTIINTQGPGLVAPGVVYSGTGSLQWDAIGYFNAPSNEILYNSPTITIDFTAPVIAFGLDVRDFSSYTATMNVTIYAANDTTVLNTYSAVTITDPAIFFGYQNSAGIGMVTLTNLAQSWSPLIDNVQFSTIPEPSVAGSLGLGLALLLANSARRRRGVGSV